MAELDNIVDFLFETGMLAKTPRSFSYFLGSGEQSVAEHINRMLYIGFTLAKLDTSVDVRKVLLLCLFHDLPEARTSDLNYVHQKYTNVNATKAVADLKQTLPFGEEIQQLIEEFETHQTKEALLAKDADQLELILSLKEQIDIGNVRAKTWLPSAIKRLKTESAKKLAEKIVTTDSDHWWYADKDDEWWVSRNKTK